MTRRRLVLIRHAKAAEDGDEDAARPLAERGVAEAPAIGRWLAEQGLVPDSVVVSPARRAQQTWALAVAAQGAVPDPVLDERIYDNTVDALLQVVRDTPADVDTLVLVGHNPSVEGLALALDDGGGDTEARSDLAHGYPTCGVAVLELQDGWSKLDTGGATLVGFVVPPG